MLGFVFWYFVGVVVSDLIGGFGWVVVIWFFNCVCVNVSVFVVFYWLVCWVVGYMFLFYLYYVLFVILVIVLVLLFMVKGMEWVLMVVILILVFGLGGVIEV